MAAWDVTTAGEAFEFETTLMSWPTRPIAVDTNHFFSAYQGAASDGFVSIFEVNTTTWAVTEAGTLEHDTQNALYNSVAQIDGNHFAVFYLGSAATTDGWVQTFTVNTTTWAITTAAARFLFDTDVGSGSSAVMIDANHIINFWTAVGSDGFVQVFTVNTTTWAVTTAAASLEFDTVLNQHNSALKVDTNHFINFFQGNGSDGFAQVFEVNTTTWAVTTAAASLEFDTQLAAWNASFAVDANHFLNFWSDQTGDGIVQVFEVNTTTWAVTTASALLEFDTDMSLTNTEYSVAQIDANHFLRVWAGPDTGGSNLYDGFAQVFEVNTTTWAVTTAGAPFEFDTTQGEYNAISALIAGYTDKFLHLFSGSGDDGFAQVLSVQLPVATVLNSPADASSDSDTTPTLDFTGTDGNGDSIEYQVQVDTVNTFDSQTINPSVESATSSGAENADPWTWNETVTDGNLLIVAIGSYSTLPNSVTFNGNAMTNIPGASISQGSIYNASIWYLVNPDAGTHEISVDFTGTMTGVGASYSVVGADTSVFDDEAEEGGTSATTNTLDLTTTFANALLIDLVAVEVTFLSTGPTPNGSTAVISGVEASGVGVGSGYKTAATPGANSMINDWTVDLGTPNYAHVGIAIKGTINPLLNVVSETDAGFVNPDTGGDTHPFNSGENIQFTVQAGDALSADTYYWRVRGKDPSGGNTWGAWSSIRSFTITAGGGVTLIYPIQRMRMGMGA